MGPQQRRDVGRGNNSGLRQESLTPGMRHIDYGLGVFQAAAFDRVPAGSPFDLAELYQQLLTDGQLSAYEVKERFYEVGSFEGIKELTAV